MDVLTFDVGLAHKLKKAFAKAGWTEANIDALAESEHLDEHRKVLLGHAEITVPEHLIDLDTGPFIPSGWKVEEHHKGGAFKWDAAKVKLHLSKGQQGGKWIEGNKLREELKNKPVCNANLLDYLLAHPHLIPEEWKGKYVFFWGTIYRLSGRLCVRCLYWGGDRWRWSNGWLDIDLVSFSPAALRAS